MAPATTAMPRDHRHPPHHAPKPQPQHHYGTRFSTSAIPEDCDTQFTWSTDAAAEQSTRHSLMQMETPGAAVRDHGGSFSDVSGMEPLHYHWQGGESDGDGDGDGGDGSNIATPRAMLGNDPYQGINVDVRHHSINNQGVVMYHVDVKGPEGILSTYTIRRRYRAFKNLHAEMSRLMNEYNNRVAGRVAIRQGGGQLTPHSSSGVAIPMSPHSESQFRHQQQFTSLTLPALPSAGVWSYLKRHDMRLVEQRKKRFQQIMRLVIRHPATRTSSALDTFLSVAPSEISQRGSSYVSLNDYSVPVVDRERESVERKQRKIRVLQEKEKRKRSNSGMARPRGSC